MSAPLERSWWNSRHKAAANGPVALVDDPNGSRSAWSFNWPNLVGRFLTSTNTITNTSSILFQIIKWRIAFASGKCPHIEANQQNHVRLERHELVWTKWREMIMIWMHVPTKWWRVRYRYRFRTGAKPPHYYIRTLTFRLSLKMPCISVYDNLVSRGTRMITSLMNSWKRLSEGNKAFVAQPIISYVHHICFVRESGNIAQDPGRVGRILHPVSKKHRHITLWHFTPVTTTVNISLGTISFYFNLTSMLGHQTAPSLFYCPRSRSHIISLVVRVLPNHVPQCLHFGIFSGRTLLFPG
jgi:hypothetical protein